MLGSARLPYRLLADMPPDFPHPHNQALSYKTQKQIGEACNNGYNDDGTVAAAHLIPLHEANGAAGGRTS